jgi:hypothetical protein
MWNLAKCAVDGIESIIERRAQIDWSFDGDAMIERMCRSVREQNGHVFLCLENFLPAPLYRACLRHWPQPYHFTPSPGGTRGRLLRKDLDTALLPLKLLAFWRRFGTDVIDRVVRPGIIEAFKPYLSRKLDFLSSQRIALAHEHLDTGTDTNEGLCRDIGFVVGPHIDQYYNLATCLFYMPSDLSQAHAGTGLYVPKTGAGSIRSTDTSFRAMEEFDEFLRFPFKPNTAVVILQSSVAWHGMMQACVGERRSYLASVVMTPRWLEALYGASPIETQPAYSESGVA